MLVDSLLDTETREGLSMEVTNYARRHGLKSEVRIRVFQYRNYDWDAKIVRGMGYDHTEKIIWLSIEGLIDQDRAWETWVTSTLSSEQLKDEHLLHQVYVACQSKFLAETIAHEVCHQMDDDNYPRLYRLGNWYATLRKRLTNSPRPLAFFLKILYEWNPLEIRARSYAKRYLSEYHEIVLRCIDTDAWQ